MKIFKGPSKFMPGLSSEYQLALMKKIHKMRYTNIKNKERADNKLFSLKEYLGFIQYNSISNKNIFDYAKIIDRTYIHYENNVIRYPKKFLDLCIKNEIIDFPLSYKIEIYGYCRIN
jgi:hypothetical protein